MNTTQIKSLQAERAARRVVNLVHEATIENSGIAIIAAQFPSVPRVAYRFGIYPNGDLLPDGVLNRTEEGLAFVDYLP